MILKKPFAILIKYFKLIHFILVGLAILLAFKTNDILRFMNDFIANKVGSVSATEHASSLNYLIIIAIIAICGIIFDLMRRKNKPKMLYLYILIVYVVTFCVLIYTGSNLQIIQDSILPTPTVHLVRDVLRFDIFAQYIAIAMIIVRALGFDIKKFDFQKEINEFQIDVKDNEEFELTIGVNTDSLKRQGRKQLRELRYYVIENKLFVTVASVIVVVIIAIFIISKIDFTKRTFKENKIITTPYYSFSVTGSSITKKNYQMQEIAKDNTSFVVVKLNIKALDSTRQYKLNTDNFLLYIGKESVKPTKKYYKSLSDLGTGYTDQVIPSDDYQEYILVYNIADNKVNKKMQLKHQEGYKIKDKVEQASVKVVKLKPVNIDKDATNISTATVGQVLTLTKSVYPDTSFTIYDYDVQETITVNEIKCESLDNCYPYDRVISPTSNSNAVLSLDIIEDKLDPSIKDINSLIKNYGVFKYQISGKEHTSKKLKLITTSASGLTSFFEVDKDAVVADKRWLEIVIRDKKYTYNLENKQD